MKFQFSKIFIGFFLFVFLQGAYAQSPSDSNPSGLDYGYSAKDAPVVTIGTQTWLGKNLNVGHFANGDVIDHASSAEEWRLAGENKQPAWCFYLMDPGNGPVYGRLYNWYAVNDPRGLAPSGWHVPSDSEWDTLIKHLAGNSVEVNKPTRMGNTIYYITKDVGTGMKSTTGWKKNKGTNVTGFGALPGSNRLTDGRYDMNDQYGSWWSSTENGPETAWYRGLYYGHGKVNRFAFYKNCGFSVRCVRD